MSPLALTLTPTLCLNPDPNPDPNPNSHQAAALSHTLEQQQRGTDGLMMGAPPEMMLDMMRSEAGARR